MGGLESHQRLIYTAGLLWFSALAATHLPLSQSNVQMQFFLTILIGFNSVFAYEERKKSRFNFR